MKILAIKQPWAAMITERIKHIEVRSMPINYGGKVAIYATRSPWDNGTPEMASQKLGSGYPYSCGAIIGTATIFECFKFIDNLHFKRYNEDHHVLDAFPSFSVEGKKKAFAWCLGDIQKLENPIPYKMPKGAVIFANDPEVEL